MAFRGEVDRALPAGADIAITNPYRRLPKISSTRPAEERNQRRSGLAKTAMVFGIGLPVALGLGGALAGCSSIGNPSPDRTTSASASTLHTGGTVRPTETFKPTPTETPTPKPEVGTASSIEADGKEVGFTLLTPEQLKDHWADFVGKDIGLVVHPPKFGKTQDVLDINIQGKLITGPKSKPTQQFVMGTVTFSNGDKFPLLYEYLTNAQQEQANDAATYNFSPTGKPFPIVGAVVSMKPGLLNYLLNQAHISNKGLNQKFLLVNVITAPDTKGIKNASTP